MKLNKQTIVVLAAGALFLLAWYRLMNHLGWTPQPVPADEQVADEQASPDSGADASGPTPADDQPPGPPMEDSTATVIVREDAESLSADAGKLREPEKTVTLSGSDDRATFTLDATRGGIVSTALHEYEPYGQKGSRESVMLGTWRFPLCGLAAAGLGGQMTAELSQTPNAVSLTRVNPGGVTIRETWRFIPETPYRFTYVVELSTSGADAVSLAPDVMFGGLTSESGAAGPKMSRVGAIDLGIDIAADTRNRPVSLNAKKIRKLGPEQKALSASSPAAWVAVHNKYFTYFLNPVLPEGTTDFIIKGLELGVTTVDAATGEENVPEEWVHARGSLGSLILEPGKPPLVFTFEGYAGPKKLALLEDLAPNADSIMRLDFFMFFRAGWMSIIAKTILRSLIALNGLIGGEWGFGFAIIIVTVVIKTLFWPLTHHSTVSMRRMSALQPQIKEIRETYKDDAQMIQRKTMELYRENKVNPAGGCLPMLLQIPVFFALFNTLRGAVELRHAAFLYISDLSMPDTLTPFGDGLPIRPLAIIMGGTMLLQQSLTPTSGDPQQKRMMTFMTLFFMFIFYSMPSGLTLYWTTNQILTIGQNLVTRRLEARKKEAAETKG